MIYLAILIQYANVTDRLRPTASIPRLRTAPRGETTVSMLRSEIKLHTEVNI